MRAGMHTCGHTPEAFIVEAVRAARRASYGSLPPAQLGPKGAKLSAQAIRRMGLAGSIGIDLPTMNNKDERMIAAAQIDKYLPLPFERTAVNGFGFVQIIRRRERANLMELLREDPVLTAALALAETKKVLVLAKGRLDSGSTAWAQGGIAAVLEPGDTFEAHIEDTMIAGAGLNDRATEGLYQWPDGMKLNDG